MRKPKLNTLRSIALSREMSLHAPVHKVLMSNAQAESQQSAMKTAIVGTARDSNRVQDARQLVGHL
jgi:hypothetical protein